MISTLIDEPVIDRVAEGRKAGPRRRAVNVKLSKIGRLGVSSQLDLPAASPQKNAPECGAF
jgi:hypothetical protein